MSFWNNPDVELKQKSKFVVTVAGDFFLPNVKTVTKPAVEFATKEYKMINHVFNYPGTVKWNPITITFIDMNGGAKKMFDTAGFLAQMINNSGYTYPHVGTHRVSTKGSKATTISTPEKSSTIANSFGPGIYGKADTGSASKKRQNVTIQQLNSEGKVNESWTLINPIIKSVKFGDLAYDSDEPVEYTLEVVYDYAIYG